ncbi:hypothetical protein F3Y22_tig00110356pilonHSYRG00235 [Hibiscus syriacus]|uniref:Uncharacterized protein n=1 Tax=Hibiscus syriacus TaxID=106335 RepID=A0A6A3AWJ6_HIBSY|nr:hypothetical protein F3Y22_tig00110356pilonHSYRG00235 [Hibiscus syriacus]
MDVRKGPWTEEEDLMLRSYVDIHGEGRWNSVAGLSGLKEAAKLQIKMDELFETGAETWSKIAQQLPGRTDNEIKNYWRTRVQKLAKQLQCDVNSKHSTGTGTFMDDISSTGTGQINHADTTMGLVECYNPLMSISDYAYSLENGSGLCSENLAGTWNSDDWVGLEATDGGDSMMSVWNEENICFLRQQLYDDDNTNKFSDA